MGTCVAALLLAVSPGARGGSSEPLVVALGSSGDILNYETLDGVVMHSVPAPPNLIITGFAPAANGSIVYTVPPPNTDSGPVWLMRSDGSTVELDSSPYDSEASISYDGSKVVFARGDPTKAGLWATDIYEINADGTDLTLVASGGGTRALLHPTFSPDGGSIAYWCGPLGTDNQSQGCGPLTDGTYRNSGLIRVGADGSDPRMIVIGAGEADEPGGPNELSWSPNGQSIVFDGSSDTLGRSGNLNELFAYHTDGSDLFSNDDPTRQVTHEMNPWGAFDGQFCGNSTQILFNKVIDDHGNSGDFSYEVNLDGTNRRQIFLSPLGLPYGVCVPPASGQAPPPLVDATHIRVPSVHTLGVKAANRKLRADNLRVGRVTYKYSAAVGKSRVVSQHPRAGAIAHRTQKAGPNVNLVVSRGRHR
jgi:hypothetical protein